MNLTFFETSAKENINVDEVKIPQKTLLKINQILSLLNNKGFYRINTKNPRTSGEKSTN